MASKEPPAHPEGGNHTLVEDAPPAYYDAARGSLDFHQDGLSTQTQVRGQLPTHDLVETRND